MVLQLSNCTGLAGSCTRHASLGRRLTYGISAQNTNALTRAGRVSRPCQSHSRKHQLMVNAVASVERPAETSEAPSVSIDNKRDSKFSAISVTAPSRANLLGHITDTLTQLGLEIAKATVDNSNGTSVNKFYVCRPGGGKLDKPEDVEALQHALESAVSPQSAGLKRPLLKQTDKSVPEDKKKFLYTLMGAHGQHSMCNSLPDSLLTAMCCRFISDQRCSQHTAERCQPSRVHSCSQPLQGVRPGGIFCYCPEFAGPSH